MEFYAPREGDDAGLRKRLESLQPVGDSAECQPDAGKHLECADHALPIIVMTSHGPKCPRLAVEIAGHGGAVSLVMKSFTEPNSLLAQTTDVLPHAEGNHAELQSPLARDDVSRLPFDRGELTYYPSRVELCGVKICGDEASGVIRRILDVLAATDAHGRRQAYSGEELAEVTGNEGGATAIAGAIRNFRQRARRTLLAEADLEIDPAGDLIVNDRQHGYRFSDKITVVERPGLLSADWEEGSVREVREICNTGESEEDARGCWILDELKRSGRIRKSQILERTGWSDSTTRRVLAKLRDEGLIVFEGSGRSGYWRPTQ